MKFKLQDIAHMLGGSLEGDANAEVWTLCKIEEGAPGAISFLANPKYTHYVYDTQATAVVVSRTFAPERPVQAALIRVDDPYRAFAALLETYNAMQQQSRKGVSSLAFVASTATLGEGCYVGEFAVIGDGATIGKNVKIYPQAYVGDHAVIGDDTILYAGVKIYGGMAIGSHCILHSGCVIGADGFGFAPKPDGTWEKIPQIGNVVVEDGVEIGANTCIDRATMGSTLVRNDVKIDNLCQVAHNVVVGNHTAMASQSGVAGSSKVGAHCILAGQVGVVGHIEVGDRVTMGAQSGVTNNVPSDSVVLGSPATEAHKQRRNLVLMRNLDKLEARVRELESKLK